MARFVYDSNNGVAAVLTAEDFSRLNHDKTLLTGFMLFSDSANYPSVGLQPWFHGNMALMNRLLDGHELARVSLWVPFSNGPTLYPSFEELLEQFGRLAPMHKLHEAFGVALTPAAVAMS